MKAMILAAGRGTRMKPLTDSMPKALIKVQGVPLLEHCIKYLKFFGIYEIIINVHHHAEQIIDFLNKNGNFGLQIVISDERDELLETGGGLYKARWFFNDNMPFVMMSSDVITNLNLEDLCAYHRRYNPIATLAVKQRTSTREFLFDENNDLCGWRNNTTGEIRWSRAVSNFKAISFSAIHVIDPVIFELITEKGIFSITDLYLRLAGERIIKGYEHNESLWFECGRIENLDLMNNLPEIKHIFRHFHSTL
jgi:NDP-sugar pyrophosphorylase family protein